MTKYAEILMTLILPKRKKKLGTYYNIARHRDFKLNTDAVASRLLTESYK